MALIKLLPVFFSALLIGAHFQRGGETIIAIICFLVPAILLITRPWSVRLVQLFLCLAAAEWLRTLVYLVQMRMEGGYDWIRLAAILSGVVIFTLASACIFFNNGVKMRYRL